nr:hypothetical protein [Tanacetum cinerariifolium]
GKPQNDHKRFIDSGCSRHMTGNIAYLSDFKEFDGGYVTFERGTHGGRISSKETASASTLEDKRMKITATIDGRIKTITEASIKRHLNLEDLDGITTLPNAKIFEHLALMATNRIFNFSKMIFDGMLKNLESASKFLKYPRFQQIFLNMHKRHHLPHKKTYTAPTSTHKLFSNMRRDSKGYNGVDIPLFLTMLVQGQIDQGVESTVPVESHHTPTYAPSTSQPPISTPFMQTTYYAEEPATMPYDSPLLKVQSLGSVEG